MNFPINIGGYDLTVSIAFDFSHGEKGNLKNTYKTLRDLFDPEKYRLRTHKEFPINFETISKYKIIVIAQPTNYLSENEINDIIKFVEKGNGLFLLGNSGGDRAHMSNLNDLAKKFGVKFNDDKVRDRENSLDDEEIVIIKDIKLHPIFTQDINEFTYPKGCSLNIISSAATKAIAWTSRNADPPKTTVFATSKLKFGRVLISGAYSQFRYDVKGGIDSQKNKDLFINAIKWLLGEEKVQEIKVPTIKFEMPQILKTPQVEPKLVSEEIEKIPIEDESFRSQIKSTLEIIEELKGTQKDFGKFKLLKNRFEYLTKMISKRLKIDLPTDFKEKVDEKSTNIEIIQKKLKELELRKESSIKLKNYIQKQHNSRVISDLEYKNKIENIEREILEIDEEIDLLESKLRIVEGMM
ncbi:MAG: Gldg family protein [Candidatus Hodarchaeota archaeon]